MEVSLLKRREGIIISTIEALNQVGLQNLSTKIIAKSEGVSEGTLFRHFKNKSEIMLAVLDHFCQYDDDIIQATINRELNPFEAIQYFVRTYAEYYESYPAITVVLQNFDSFLCDSELSATMRGIITKRMNFILETSEKAKKLGMIGSHIDCENLADLIMGGSREICLRWRMNKYSFSLKDKTVSMLSMLLSSISSER
ncbi:MAG: transcriptional regulator [Clostridiales bacterium]|jgi:AcrR family transcriptional regulator|nr:transcriptional regulator [Clostridiales bacterium]